MKPTGRGRWVPGLAVLGAFVVFGGVAQAQQKPRAVEVENIRIGFDDRFKVGTWTPVRLQLRGGEVGFTGVVELITNDADSTPTTVRQQVQVNAGGTQRVTLYTRPGSLDSEMFLRFYDAKSGRKVGPDLSTLALMGDKNLSPLWAEDMEILALGTTSGAELIPSIPGFNVSTNASGRIREVSVARINALDDLLPAFRQGYDAVDVILLDTADKPLLAQVGGRLEGIEQWVRAGGHLVLSVSSNWQEVNERLGRLLPARIEGQVSVNDLGSIESFVTGTTTPLVPVGSGPVLVAKLTDVEAKGSKVLASTASNPLIVRGSLGFGRVTLVGLDTDREPFRNWEDRKNFWIRAADLKPVTSGNAGGNARGRFIQTNIGDLATLLRKGLDQFPKVRLVPFGYVAFFIFLYILLIGPGDYFLLKKVFKRMELTWITFPLIVVSVSLLAYYAAYVIKGTELRVNKVDVLDVDQQGRTVRGASFANVFSPRNDDYEVALTPLTLDRPAPEAGTPAPPPPPATQTLVSWFAASESGLRGMNTGGRGLSFGGAGYSYGPPGKAEVIEGIRIPIWSTRCFSGNWSGPATADAIESDFVLSGTDRLLGTFTNRLNVPIDDVIVAFGGTVYYNIGTMAPNATVRIELQSSRNLAGYLNEIRSKYMPNDYGYNPAAIQRDPLMRAILFHDSEAGNQGELPSRVLHNLDMTGLLKLGHPVVVGRIARPVAALSLGVGKAKPEIDQTTLLRVVLPVVRPPAAAKPR